MFFLIKDIKRLLNKLGLFSGDEDDNETQRHFDDDYLDYQSAFHDLFEWLTATEEEIQNVSVCESDEVKEARQRVKRVQVTPWFKYIVGIFKAFTNWVCCSEIKSE